MILLLRFFLLSSSIFLSSLSYAEIIKNIEIIGLNTVSRGSVLSYIPFEKGDEYSIKNSNKVLNSLMVTGLFEHISINFDDNETLKISVKENPTIKFFELKNYSDGKVLSQDIIEQLKKNFQLEPGKVFITKKFDDFLKQLTGIYVNSGYYNTSFKLEKKVDQENRVSIDIDIDEKVPAKISSLKILGPKHFETEDLLDEFEIGEPDFFLINYFTKKDQFDPNKLKAGIEAIRTKYLNNGFLNIKISEPNVEFQSEKKDFIDIVIEINEGVQFKLRKVHFETEILDLYPDISNNFSLKTGDIFDRKALSKSIKNINKKFADKGYAYSNVETVISSITDNEVDLKVIVAKGELTYINRIEISGNTRTQDSVIRREMLLLEGQLYSDTAFNDSISNIKRLGYFSNVQMNAAKDSKNPDKVNIFVKVTESKTGEFSIGVSHSNSTGASFNLGIQENNFLGTGKTLKAKFNNSKAVQEKSFYFLDPHVNNQGHSASIGFFFKSIDAANLDVSSYKIDQNGVSSGYGIPISSNSDIFADLSFSKYEVTCGTLFGSVGYEQSQCLSPDNNEFAMELKYSHSSLNDFYFPTKGEKSNISSKLALPIGDLNYLSASASYENYDEIFEDFTLKVSTNLSAASGYGNNELPFYKRFYAGGSSSVRGFDFNSLGSVYANGKAKGGELSLLSNISLITPFYLANNPEKMRIGGFIDAGALSEKISSFDPNDLRVSTGVAFTWLTPIGPLGFHMAKPLIKKENDKLKTFELSLGSSF